MSSPSLYPCPYKLRAFDGRRFVTVQSVCFNQGGCLWYGEANQHGWAWVNEGYDGWTEGNPKPGALDICPLMRWSGLRDKNGVDIWEADIIEFCDESNMTRRGAVEWRSYGDDENVECWMVGEYNLPLSAVHTGGVKWDRGQETNGEYPMVVGNVHEHKDILKT
jgi:hypothetical protein